MLITLHGSENSENSIHAYDFTNSIKSGLLLKPESRIALISSTLERIASLIITEGTNNNIQIELDNDRNGFKNILIPPGTYTTHTLATAVQLALNNVYGNLGYVFTVVYKNTDKHFHITWDEGTHQAKEGDISYQDVDTLIVATETNTGTKLALDITAIAGSQNKAISSNSLPNYKNFPFTPTVYNEGIFYKCQIDFPAGQGEQFIGLSPFASLDSVDYQDAIFPIPQHFALGYCGLHIDIEGDIFVYESTRVPIFRDYMVGNATDATQADGWQNAIYPTKAPGGAFFTFKDYIGTNGWDYTVERRIGAAAPSFFYIKRVDERNVLMAMTDTQDPNANYDFAGVLEADNLTILWSQPDGTAQSYWITTQTIPLSTGVSKSVTPLGLEQNTIIKPGAYVGLSYGYEGYIKYWHSSNGNVYEEIQLATSSRPTTQEIFGDGNGVYPYAIMIAPITADIDNNSINNITASIALNGIQEEIDFSVATQNEGAVVFVKETATEQNTTTSSAINSYVLKLNDPLNNGNIIPHHSYGQIFCHIPIDQQDIITGRFGVVKEEDLPAIVITPGSLDTETDIVVQWQFYDTGGSNGARAKVNGVGVGDVIDFTGTEDFKFIINFNLEGTVSFQYSTSDDYETIITVAALSDGEFENQALYPCVYFETATGSISDIQIIQEIHNTNTGIVHFKPDTMKNVLGFSALEYKSDDGKIGFVGNKNVTNSNAFTCGSPNIHVQLMNLPILSCNGLTKTTEKAIAIVPRYETDSHNDDGDSLLHYQPNTYLYSPLHNKQPIAFNQVDVRLTNDDGTIATDIVCCDLVLDILPHLY